MIKVPFRLLDSLESVAIYDAGLRCVYVNATYRALTGHALEDVRGMTRGEILGVDEGEDYSRAAELKRALAGEEGVTWQHVWRDGRVYEVELFPTRDDDGAISGVLVYGIDITARESRMREERFRAMQRATSEIANHLAQDLTVVGSTADLLREGVSDLRLLLDQLRAFSLANPSSGEAPETILAQTGVVHSAHSASSLRAEPRA
jgi:PAS domain S-box-containing protein